MSLIAAALVMSSLPSQTLAPQVPAKWTLVWKDEFDRPGAPDPKFWGYEEGYVRNNEKQFYTKDRRENARVEGGKLVIEARKDGFNGKEVTSASLTTAGKQDILYGRIEVRAKVPTGKGTWPAIWTLGTNIGKAGWPMCGEIDMMENVGYDPDKVHFNIHTKAYNHMNKTGKGASIAVPQVWEGFHDYALEWRPDRLDFFFDGKLSFTFMKEANATKETWPYDEPQYLILNLAIGGAWGGQQGIDEAIYPSRFEVESVKVYKQAL